MDLNTLLIALPIFFVLYRGVGMLLENRRRPAWQTPQASQRPWASLMERGGQMGANGWLLRREAFRENLDMMLVRSGNLFGWTAESFLLYKELGAILVIIFLWQLEMRHPLALAAGAYFGFKALDIYLSLKAAGRREDMQRQLPGYIDLLALTLESGLDLVVATERIIDKMKPNALRDELQSLLQESKLGTSRKEALQHLAYRANLSDIQSLTSMIIQSEELGTSLAIVLRTYAEDMRNKRILRAEEIAGKAPVKLLFPMMVFFFPIVFIIIFGPLALNFLKGYK
jgi:tight adherence protein C